MSDEKFGAFVRRHREAKEIGLREMAKMIGVSPTYLSKVERDEFAPPVEDKVKAIAKIIGCDTDELMARADRVSSDLSDIIKRHPVELAKVGRPPRRRDLQRQYDLNPARCHFITVSGFKTARAFRTVGANRYSPAKIKRSMALNVCLLGECRLSMLI
jgi:transcriptional regulator with XRE-family HTH domain